MDPNANGGPVNPGPHPKPHDIAEAGPIDPATGQPDHHAEVSAVKAWLRQNAVSLVVTAVVVALVCIYLDPIDTVKVVIGLGFIIFIHELGHFLAAKWCDVHVRTFSIGFGPAVPFCSYKWGETTYMLGIIPLGGYVSMVGEGDSAGDEEAEEDPRSFKNKRVGQRLLIISAGVVMNIILGMGCFVAAYLHGVREEPATAGTVAAGSAAWKADLRAGDHIVSIGGRNNPSFKDLKGFVISTQKGELVDVEIDRPKPDGTTERKTVQVEPVREEGSYFPQLGITAPARLALPEPTKRKGPKPTLTGTPAAAANPAFQPGDRIVGMSDPDKPAVPNGPREATPLPHGPDGWPDLNAYYRRMVLLAAEPIDFEVVKPGDDVRRHIVVAPAFRSDLGVRMKMGVVTAIRAGSPAEKAKVAARTADGPPTGGDVIVEVAFTAADGKRVRYANGTGDKTGPLDPVLLPHQLDRWAASNPPDRKVELVVLREVEHTQRRVTLALDYDDSFRFDREVTASRNGPLPVPGLGLAYLVEAVVDEVRPGSPAAEAKLEPGDLVTAVRFKDIDDAGAVKAGEWDDIQPHQWASTETVFQRLPAHEIDLRVTKKGDGSTAEVTLKGRPDHEWPVPDRGLQFQDDTRIHQAADIGEALTLGNRRTWRFVKDIYMNLYGMIRGRISAKAMSGPLSIANVSYRLAGEDFWQFLLFIGMISVNLAVVNFLPIPVLDGGHAVFLILEKILGRPVPERLFAVAMYIGLALILTLFVFVITLDIRRVFFGLF